MIPTMIAPPEQTPRLGHYGAALPGTAAAKAAFAGARALVCPHLLDGDLLATLLRAADRSTYASNDVEGLGHREMERPPVVGTAVLLALRRPALHRWLEEVTGCETITRADGCVARTLARGGDELTWHDDLGDSTRRLGITIGLGGGTYEGGLFEMRDRPSNAPLLSFKHDTPGTALIFEVSRRCEHRVHPLVSGGPRRVFAGWFLE